MLQNRNLAGLQQSVIASSAVDELTIKLRMPVGFQGRTVPTNIVIMELFWQHYGLDILHPELNRWLELNAPEVKALMAAGGDGRDGAKFQVESNGSIVLRLSLKTDDRLREISSRYLLNQMGSQMESSRELPQAA
jgi:hypothetical protein